LRNWKGDAAPLFYSAPPAAEPAPAPIHVSLFNFGQVAPGAQPPETARPVGPLKPAKIASNQTTSAALAPTEPRPAATQTTAPAVQTAAADARSAPVDGFTLRSPVAGQFVADVQVPRNSWFSLASATTECESGTCKLVPVAKADRKLNTLLEWSSTPQLAAEQAARDGKLVYLIHVSGNFAQPGFT
jgi:hypothetical protein